MAISAVIILFGFWISIINSCLPNGHNDQVTIGQKTYICLYLAPTRWNTTGQYLRIATTFKADEVTSIRVPNSWTSQYYNNDTLMDSLLISEESGQGLGVTVGSMGVLSFQRIYRQIQSQPSFSPTFEPTIEQTSVPSGPSSEPSIFLPTFYPTYIPTNPTMIPTEIPTIPTNDPSPLPTAIPSTHSPTITAIPSAVPSTSIPSTTPSETPTSEPTPTPTTAVILKRNMEKNIFDHRSLVESASSHKTYPLLMAVIEVVKGKVKSIVWDNNCHWCHSSRCEANTFDYDENVVNERGQNCWINDEECVAIDHSNTNVTTNRLCELNVYIVWTGSDSSGQNFRSSAARFSRLSTTQLTNITSTLLDTFALEILPTPSPTSQPTLRTTITPTSISTTIST
eukprot:gene8170-11055_t